MWQNATKLMIYKSSGNTLVLQTSTPLSNANGQTHRYKVTYNPANGQFAVWRDGVAVLNWTDSNAPHSSGSYIALRTSKSVVRFDNIRITGNPATNSTLYHLYGDHLGSTSVLADSSGQVVDKTYYLPFGEYRRGDSSILTESGFTGHLHNDTLGLIYMNARFYSPSSGRFISADTIIPDPTNPQTYNRYAYVYNNPINLVDPSGHKACGASSDCSDYEPVSNRRKGNISNIIPQDKFDIWPVSTTAPGYDPWQGFGDTDFAYETGYYRRSFANLHSGIDIGLDPGAELIALGDGIVDCVGLGCGINDAEYGVGVRYASCNCIVIYGHIGSELLVTDEQEVHAGMIIAKSGDMLSTATLDDAHLHLEIRPINSTGLTVFNPKYFFESDVLEAAGIDFSGYHNNYENPDTRIVAFTSIDYNQQPRRSYNYWSVPTSADGPVPAIWVTHGEIYR